MEKKRLHISILMMAAILIGLYLIGANRKTDYIPAEEFRPEKSRQPVYPDRFTCEGHQCDKL